MEEALIALFQIVVEILFQFLAYAPTDFPVFRSKDDPEGDGCSWMIILLFVGGFVGWLSLLIVSHVVIPYPALRIANLLIAPIGAGLISFVSAKYRRKRGFKVKPINHFWYAFCFAFAFSVIRFSFAKH